MSEFLKLVNPSELMEIVLLLVAFGMAYQALKSESKRLSEAIADFKEEHVERFKKIASDHEKIETRVDKMEEILVVLARQDERIKTMDDRLLEQGRRIDSTAMIINGRLEAINNIVAGHTAKLDQFTRSKP
jgi:small-conductance mechanosensitive channel